MAEWTATDLARVAAGWLDAGAPAVMAGLELGGPPRGTDLVVFRVLGIRQIMQGWLVPATGWRALGALVDAAHLASMLPLAAASPRWRRAALIQAAVAGAFLVAGARDAAAGR